MDPSRPEVLEIPLLTQRGFGRWQCAVRKHALLDNAPRSGDQGRCRSERFGRTPYDAPMARRLTVLLLALVAIGSAACSATRSSSSPTTTSPSPTVPSTQATTTTTGPVGPMCGNGQISVSIQTSYVGAGSAAEELGFLNVSKSLCTLDGYPGVAALDLYGHQIAQAERSDIDGGPPTDVNLRPGQLAEALIQGSDGSSQTCGSFTRSFLVTPPNMTQPAEVTASSTSATIGVSDACPISIGPVTPETPQPTPSG